MATVPYTFATATSPIPLSQLDANFAAIGGGTYLSVADYGAVGNGTTNDATAIQNAINAAAASAYSGAATVYFPPGLYRINSGLTLKNGVILVGNGEIGTEIRYYGSGSAISSITPSTRIYNTGISYMTIKNSGGSGSIGLDLSSVNTSAFAQLSIEQFPTAVKIYSPSSGYAVYNRFYNVTANATTSKGFWITGTSSNANTFWACRYNSSSSTSVGYGFLIENSNGNQIFACQADMAGTIDYFARITSTLGPGGADGNVFWGNRIEGFTPANTNNGFLIGADVRYTVIGGNYYSSIDKPLEDLGTGTVMLDPSWTTPGISGYFPTATVVGGQIVYLRDQSGGTYNPFMVLNDSNSSTGTPVTLQLITQRGTGQSLQVLRQGNTSSISNITQANPCVITTSGSHGITIGSKVALSGISGMTQLNGVTAMVSAVTSNTITLGGVDSSAYSAYSSGGSVVPQVTQFAVGGDGMIVQQNVQQAASSPTSSALYVGQLYVDTNANQAYISYRTGFGSGDWKIIT